jgi:type II secretory pathway component GspD/PulD (secretin)
MRSEIGRVLVDPESGNALVIDIPEKIQKMREALETFEQKNEVRIFPLEYAKAKDVEEQLKNQLDGKKVGLIKADDRANQVMVQTLPDRMKDIERMIHELDAKTREVNIETSIVKIKFTDSTTTGVNWEGLNSITGRNNTLLYAGSTPFTTVNPVTSAGSFTSRLQTYNTVQGVGSYPFSGTTSALNSSVPDVGAESLNVGIVSSNRDLNMVLKYIETLGSAKILANPKIVVTNNQESRIHVGERQAYVTTTTTTGQVTNTVAENVTFVDVGTQIAITPVINKDGFVTMKVKAEISSVTSTLTAPSQNKIPIIDTSLAETTVMVKEGSTVILGGLKRDEKDMDTKRTPFLGSIPLLGNLFKTTTNSVDHTELIILLTPKVISGEAFVSASGQMVEKSGIKESQDYGALKVYKKGSSTKAMASAAENEQKPEFKGVKESQ